MKEPRQVGKDYNTKKGQVHIPKLIYADIPSADGWVNAKEWLPQNFDLVTMKTKNRYIQGWYQGTRWDGYKYKGEDVTHWKRVV